jgi:queuine tRNA-ribosyltransferase
MSLAKNRKVSDEGVTFRSHLDGNETFLTPEKSIAIQAKLGVDVSMALDECPPYPCTREEAAQAMQRTHLWAPRNLAARKEGQAVFGIVQGGIHEDLRKESAQTITNLDFDGFAIGGVSVGEPTDMQYPVVAYTAPLLPPDKPRYLMGVGHPQDIINAVASGIDMFDCVLPTRMARHHSLYTLNGRINAANQEWADHDGPHDPGSVFPCTERYSAAYIRHLFKTDEPLAARLATLHNLAFYARLMTEVREAIGAGSWPELAERYSRA